MYNERSYEVIKELLDNEEFSTLMETESFILFISDLEAKLAVREPEILTALVSSPSSLKGLSFMLTIAWGMGRYNVDLPTDEEVLEFKDNPSIAQLITLFSGK